MLGLHMRAHWFLYYDPRILAPVVCNIPTHFHTEANALKCLALNPWYKEGLFVIEFAGLEGQKGMDADLTQRVRFSEQKSRIVECGCKDRI